MSQLRARRRLRRNRVDARARRRAVARAAAPSLAHAGMPLGHTMVDGWSMPDMARGTVGALVVRVPRAARRAPRAPRARCVAGVSHNDNLAKSRTSNTPTAFKFICYCTVLSTAGRGCAGAVPPTSPQPSKCRCRLTSRSLCRAAALCCSSLLLRTAPLLSGRLLFLSLCVPLAVTTYLCPQTANACGGRRNGRKG